VEGDWGGKLGEEGGATPLLTWGPETVTQLQSPARCGSHLESKPTVGDTCNAPTEVCKCINRFTFLDTMYHPPFTCFVAICR